MFALRSLAPSVVERRRGHRVLYFEVPNGRTAQAVGVDHQQAHYPEGFPQATTPANINNTFLLQHPWALPICGQSSPSIIWQPPPWIILRRRVPRHPSYTSRHVPTWYGRPWDPRTSGQPSDGYHRDGRGELDGRRRLRFPVRLIIHSQRPCDT